MSTITVQVPESAFSAIRRSPVEIAGVNRAEFMEAARRRQISVVQENAAEALEEMARG
ncbi:hypothetical protein GGI1_24621 [Acidithiobacillus sp. GGI-221]|nr:hypothetical protein GGI1_24621 [Acidithiobacillus sp. GGI-221]